ncbi:MAG: CDP-glycerol glycerophosphotransferase family protein [Planctomycetota bacterium]
MRLIPSRRRWVLFSADNGVCVVMYRPIAEKLRGDRRVRQFHSMHLKRLRRVDKGDREDPKGFFRKFGIHEGVTPYKVARNLPVDLFVTPTFSDKVHARWARCKVQIFHGVSFKNYSIKEKALRYDRLFLPGEYHLRRYIDSGLFKEGDPRLEMIGLPKLDRLVNGSLDRERILLDLDLDPALKTVLYAPTGDPGNSLFRHGEEIIAALKKLPINVIVKPHDHADLDPKCTIDWPEKLASMKGERFSPDTGSDIVPLLFAADLLLTDASSVAFEYTLMDRPIIHFEVPEIMAGRYSHMFDLSTWGLKGGDMAGSADDLLEMVPRLLEDPSGKSEIRRAIARDLFHQPGKATGNAVRCILDLVSLEPLAAADESLSAG